MKLSEAMRAGMLVTKPIRGTLLKECTDGELGACALGAVYIGAKGVAKARRALNGEQEDVLLVNLFPALSAYVAHPLTGRPTMLHQLIVQLNDGAYEVVWSREEIAAWLERLGY